VRLGGNLSQVIVPGRIKEISVPLTVIPYNQKCEEKKMLRRDTQGNILK
jgi:hypothetical protein